MQKSRLHICQSLVYACDTKANTVHAKHMANLQEQILECKMKNYNLARHNLVTKKEESKLFNPTLQLYTKTFRREKKILQTYTAKLLEYE